MKVLVSYMHRGASRFETAYGYRELEIGFWDTQAVTETLGELLGTDPTGIIITNVFEIPTSRFTKQEKDNLKSWVKIASEYIESDDDVQYGIIQNLIKELNE